jgi:ABC-2 type transport system ATP-binding protein
MWGKGVKECLVQIRALDKAFGSRLALSNINLEIERGKILALAGPDGAGKSTLIRMMAALLTPTRGSVLVNGFDTVKEPEKIHELIGFMPQKFGLYEDLTVQQNLKLFADLQGVENGGDELLERMDLKPFVGRLAGNLSGGMKQKLGLACALIRKPLLLLLDEPTVGVDPLSRRELWKMIQNYQKEGITIIWSTAYLDEAAKCDGAILMNEGNVLFYGEPQELMQRVEGRVFHVSAEPQEKRGKLKALLSDPKTLDATIQGKEIRLVVKEKGEKGEGWTETAPRFEDGFLDLLGHLPGGKSPLSDELENIESKGDVAIIAEGLTKKFGSFTAVDRVSFQVKAGEIFGLLGPNGAGKSTTFKMLCGLLQPTSGAGFVNGLDLEKAPKQARSQIGYMAQKFSLYGELSAKQNLDFFAGVYGVQKKERVEEMIEMFDLKQFLGLAAKELPLGFKQRLALSCSLMHNPSVLFLDEPTSGVDPITRREFWNHINAVIEKGCTVIVTTHFMDEAEYCDRIGLIFKSRLIAVGSPDELKEKASAPTLEEAFISLIEKEN